jgi:hypothetical protein
MDMSMEKDGHGHEHGSGHFAVMQDVTIELSYCIAGRFCLPIGVVVDFSAEIHLYRLLPLTLKYF